MHLNSVISLILLNVETQEIESVKMREKLKDVDNLRRELSDKQNRIVGLETDLNYLEGILQKKLQENDRKNEDLSLLQNQVCFFSAE